MYLKFNLWFTFFKLFVQETLAPDAPGIGHIEGAKKMEREFPVHGRIARVVAYVGVKWCDGLGGVVAGVRSDYPLWRGRVQ